MQHTSTMQILLDANAAKPAMAALQEQDKNTALIAMADALLERTEAILAANAEDMEAARGHISDVMLDRLHLTEARVADMADGVRAVAKLPDPVGRVLAENVLDNGLQIQKVSVPLGVVAVIYESRPNVTSDAAALCLKSSNVCVLRGGKEAFRSANAVVDALRAGLARCGLPPALINLVQDTARSSANELMNAVGLVDLLVPRGGAGLIKACVDNARVPCIETGTGICHIYVDESADPDMALNILENAKTQRPSVCNAAEVCLLHANIAEAFLPRLYDRLAAGRAARSLPPVELRLDGAAAVAAHGAFPFTLAGPADFDTEFLDYILAVALVDSTDQAVAHIARHSTHHSDAIVTRSDESAAAFLAGVDSAAVYVNASTRFTDGGVFGLGCEVGISTQKLHARGPMGIAEMTTYKYVVRGTGQVR